MNYKKVRKCVKRAMFSTPNLRTHRNIGNPIKKTPKRVFLIFGSPTASLTNNNQTHVQKLY